VQFFAERPQQVNQAPLDGEVHILGLQARIEVTGGGLGADPLEARDQLVRLARGEHTALSQHAGVGD
jgi:hypothetical protein